MQEQDDDENQIEYLGKGRSKELLGLSGEDLARLTTLVPLGTGKPVEPEPKMILSDDD